MIPVRRVGCPVGIRVMRRDEADSTAGFGDAVEFRYKSHHVRYVFDDVARNYQIEFIVGKRIRNFSKIVNHVSRRARIVIQTDRAFELIRAAADIENFCHQRYFHLKAAKNTKQ